MLLGHHCHHYYADPIQNPELLIVLNWDTQLGKAKWLSPAGQRWSLSYELLERDSRVPTTSWEAFECSDRQREVNSERSSQQFFKFWGLISMLWSPFKFHSSLFSWNRFMNFWDDFMSLFLALNPAPTPPQFCTKLWRARFTREGPTHYYKPQRKEHILFPITCRLEDLLHLPRLGHLVLSEMLLDT